MNLSQYRGFTLVEMMIVIGIMSAMTFFFVKQYSRELRDILVGQAAASVLDVKRSSLAYFVSVGRWPDQENGCINGPELLTPMIGQLGDNPWGYPMSTLCVTWQVDRDIVDQFGEISVESIDVRASLQIQQQVPSSAVAAQLAGRLPSTHVEDRDGALFVITFVPMALLPAGDDVSSQVTQTEDNLIYRVIRCPAGQTADAVLMPANICTSTEGGLYGFRLQSSRSSSFQGTRQVLFEVQDRTGAWVSGFAACELDPVDAVRIYQYCS